MPKLLHSTVCKYRCNVLLKYKKIFNAYLQACVCVLVYYLALETPLQCLREELQIEITEALACYRKHCCTTSVSPGQVCQETHTHKQFTDV